MENQNRMEAAHHDGSCCYNAGSDESERLESVNMASGGRIGCAHHDGSCCNNANSEQSERLGSENGNNQHDGIPCSCNLETNGRMET